MFKKSRPLYELANIVLWCIENFVEHLVGNKIKGRISKRVFQENKAHQIFWKTSISYLLMPSDTIYEDAFLRK